MTWIELGSCHFNMTAKLEISTLAFFTVSFLSISIATNNKTETFIAKTFTKNPTNTHKYPISLSLSQSHYQLTLTFSISLSSHSNSPTALNLPLSLNLTLALILSLPFALGLPLSLALTLILGLPLALDLPLSLNLALYSPSCSRSLLSLSVCIFNLESQGMSPYLNICLCIRYMWVGYIHKIIQNNYNAKIFWITMVAVPTNLIVLNGNLQLDRAKLGSDTKKGVSYTCCNCWIPGD